MVLRSKRTIRNLSYRPAILLANETSYLATKPFLAQFERGAISEPSVNLFSPLSPCRMAGPRDTAFDLGIKQLLCGDNEDDENFWAYFSEFVDAEQPPLTLPRAAQLYICTHAL